MQAIVAQEDNYVVLPDRCIGCGVCTNTCPVNAITLVRKPDDQRDEPPQNMLEWYSDRAASRGIKITV
jgi:Fe-S-cluster-containing hydrogenase component 2